MPDQPGMPQERPGSTGADDLAIPGGEDDRGSPACIGTPDRPGVPRRTGSTGTDDLAIPGGEGDRGSPACIGTPDRPGVQLKIRGNRWLLREEIIVFLFFCS